MSKLNTLVNKIINSEGKLDVEALFNYLDLVNNKIEDNIFNNFNGRKLNVSISKSETDYPISHGLNFIPNFAIIIKQVTSTPEVTFNFNKFTNKDIFITTDAAVNIDVLVGRLDE